MRYADTIHLYRPGTGSGTQDPDTGAWTPTPNASAEYYHGAADVQDVGFVLSRDALGMPTSVSDGAAFLQDERILPFVTDGDRMEIDMADGSRTTAEVKTARQLDGAIFFMWQH